MQTMQLLEKIILNYINQRKEIFSKFIHLGIYQLQRTLCFNVYALDQDAC